MRTIDLSLLSVVAFSFALVHCGGDDTAAPGAGGGSGSVAFDGGASGQAGTSATGGAGGTAVMGSGGSSVGGSVTMDASVPRVDASACPASEPSGACSATMPCYYPMSYCYCDRDVLDGGGNRWFCNGGDSGLTANCPAQKPMAGTACPTADLTYCHYDTGVCICNGRGGGNNKSNWSCF
jgi:hypothetical protein